MPEPEALKPCPFCGEQPVYSLFSPPDTQERIVWCQHCGANSCEDNWQHCARPRFTKEEREALEAGRAAAEMYAGDNEDASREPFASMKRAAATIRHMLEEA